MVIVLVNESINELLNYALEQLLIEEADIDFVINQLLDLLQLDGFLFSTKKSTKMIDEILQPILDYAVVKKIITNDTIDERDLFDTKIMGLLTPRPSVVNKQFQLRYETNPRSATRYFYELSQGVNYIRTSRVAKDKRWKAVTEYGELDLSINLSKPEKDPKTIAMAKTVVSSGYPQCLLCKENVGYAGHLNHPARQNHRIIPLELNDEQWYLQYSPYVYYNEHCIVLKAEHEPMKISRLTFERLLDFVSQFKHYFVGSNADLPIVGGSILSHDHFQGGNYRFAMDDAEVIDVFTINRFSNVKIELLKWPLTTLRLKGIDVDELTDLAEHILTVWRGHSDESCGICAFTSETPHNTITPIARFRDGNYELDLVLRNNRTSTEHPDGIFHPHQQYHHLKKENIGLIEVMGLAILPGRLLTEFEIIKQALLKQDINLLLNAGLQKHQLWYEELIEQCFNMSESVIEELIYQSVGTKFSEILACCGVYKLDEVGLAGVKHFVEVL